MKKIRLTSAPVVLIIKEFVKDIDPFMKLALAMVSFTVIMIAFAVDHFNTPSCFDAIRLIENGYLSGEYEVYKNEDINDPIALVLKPAAIFAENGAMLCSHSGSSEFHSDKFFEIVIDAEEKKEREFEMKIKAFEQELDKK